MTFQDEISELVRKMVVITETVHHNVDGYLRLKYSALFDADNGFIDPHKTLEREHITSEDLEEEDRMLVCNCGYDTHWTIEMLQHLEHEHRWVDVSATLAIHLNHNNVEVYSLNDHNVESLMETWEDIRAAAHLVVEACELRDFA